MDRNIFDGLWLQRFRWIPHLGRLMRELSQPSRKLILERNQALRNEPGALRDLSFGRLLLTVPLEDLHALREKYPDLASRDATIRTRAWLTFAQSDESKPYRVK